MIEEIYEKIQFDSKVCGTCKYFRSFRNDSVKQFDSSRIDSGVGFCKHPSVGNNELTVSAEDECIILNGNGWKEDND